MSELVSLLTPAQEMTRVLSLGLQLDRQGTRRLLRDLEKLDSAVPGCVCMQAQLRFALERRDWLVISVVADPRTVLTSGISWGIVQHKPTKKPGLTPMQRWQKNKGLRR